MIDSKEEAAIGDKAAKELLASEKALQVKHTPAPWLIEGATVYALEHNGWRKGIEQLCNRFTASISGNHFTILKEELIANTRLIAAAPELLEALKYLLEREWKDDDFDETLINARDKAKAAIAKALGETK